MNKIAFYFFRYFNYLFALVIAAMYVNALIFPNMGLDASYYLRVTECIMDGAIPEHDLRILYPPLVFYMLLPVKLIVGNAIAYEIFLGYMFIIQGINAFLIFKISSKYSQNNFIRAFAALLYLFLSIKLEGEYFFLEPFINLWGLLAIWIYLQYGKKNHYWLMLSGLLAFLAFLVKQYGLAYAGIISVLVIIDEKESWKILLVKNTMFITGLLGGLLVFIFLFRIGYGEYYDFFAGGRLSLYGEKDPQELMAGLFKYIQIAPFLIFLLLPGIFRNLLNLKTHFIPFFLLIILFSVQLFFQQYDHYYILMLPGLILIGVMVFELIYNHNKNALILIIFISLFINEAFIGARTKSMILSNHTTLGKEINIAQNINTVIPAGAKVYLFTDVKLYYLCHFNPVIPERYGYAYVNALNKKDVEDILSKAEYVLISDQQENQKYQLIDKSFTIKTDSLFSGFDQSFSLGNYLIFQRTKSN